jgi:hypothetical protein
VREGFRQLENRFGRFLLKRSYSEITDTSNMLEHVYLARFVNYVEFILVEQAMNSIPMTYGYFVSRPFTSSEVSSSTEKISSLALYPNPAVSQITVLTNNDIDAFESILIYDMRGTLKRVFSHLNSGRQTISLIGLTPGEYNIIIGPYSKEFIVLR